MEGHCKDSNIQRDLWIKNLKERISRHNTILCLRTQDLELDKVLLKS